MEDVSAQELVCLDCVLTHAEYLADRLSKLTFSIEFSEDPSLKEGCELGSLAEAAQTLRKNGFLYSMRHGECGGYAKTYVDVWEDGKKVTGPQQAVRIDLSVSDADPEDTLRAASMGHINDTPEGPST